MKRRLLAAEAGLVAKTLEAEKLKLELARLKRMQFGQSSERIAREIEQLELRLEEVETTASDIAEDNAAPDDVAVVAARRDAPGSHYGHVVRSLRICRA